MERAQFNSRSPTASNTTHQIGFNVIDAETRRMSRDSAFLLLDKPVAESLMLPMNSHLGIDMQKHDKYGYAMVGVKGYKEGAATEENAGRFSQDTDKAFYGKLGGKTGKGFMILIEFDDGTFGKPFASNEDGTVNWLALGNMIGTKQIKNMTVIVNVYSPGDLPSNASELVSNGSGYSLASPQDQQFESKGHSSSGAAVNGQFASFQLAGVDISAIFEQSRRYAMRIGAASMQLSSIAFSRTANVFHSIFPHFNFILSTNLELVRRQRMLEQSAQRRVQKMLLFDAAAPTPQGAGATENFQSDFTPFPNAPVLPAFGIDGSPTSFESGDYSGSSGGERMRSGAKEANKSQQKNLNSVSNPNSRSQTSNTLSNVSNANSMTVQTPVSNPVSFNVKNSAPTKTDTRTKNTTSFSNFQTQAPISEGKTQVHNLETTIHAPVLNVQKTFAAQKNQLCVFNAQMQSVANAHVQTQAAQISIQQAAQHEQQAQLQSAQTQILHAQPESMQTIAQAEEVQVQQPALQQVQVTASTHQEQVVQALLQESQVQIPVAAQRIRTEKKMAGEKIIPRVPIAVSANADKGNKKENSMNANKKELTLNASSEENENRPIQQAKPAPRRIIPQAVAFLPLRNLFENNKRNKKEKHECASKVCGWCGRWGA